MSSEDEYKPFDEKFERRVILVAAGAGVVLVLAGISILIGWITGTGTLFQTSTLSEMGICTQNDVYNPQTHIPEGQEMIYICGQIDGDTKRYVSFFLYNETNRVFTEGKNRQPGVFFIPVYAKDLWYIDSSEFPVGDYRLDAIYTRDPFTTTVFSVGELE